MKYKLIKAFDVSGFTFLTPVVRLCYGEDPRKQVKEIIHFIAIPVLVFVAFLIGWNYLAPKHKTRSGEVPTPMVVWDAASSAWKFHLREGDKSSAYAMAADVREQQLAEVEGRLEELAPLQVKADEQVVAVEQQLATELAAELEPYQRVYRALDYKYRKVDQEAQDRLETLGAKIPVGNKELHKKYLAKVREFLTMSEQRSEHLKSIKAAENEIRSRKFPELEEARKAQTLLAEERQYLAKMQEQLSENNRAKKVDAAARDLALDLNKFYGATGAATYSQAQSIARTEKRIQTMLESEYAKPWTLPDQVMRSVACVFFGFFLASAIAIPIGVLCGLNETFMAAITPFIALFKPVSPIVWLPISLIIVGGFIADPDKHWLMQFFANMPLLGWMKINPAFIASGVTVALCSLWPTLANTALGVASIDKDHLNVARVLRLGFWTRLFKVIIPSAMPLIFAGLRISLGVGWMVLIAAELLSSSEGIGKFVWDQFNNGASESFARLFVAVFVVGVIGFALDRIMIVLQRMVSFDGAPAAL